MLEIFNLKVDWNFTITPNLHLALVCSEIVSWDGDLLLRIEVRAATELGQNQSYLSLVKVYFSWHFRKLVAFFSELFLSLTFGEHNGN